ncbi:MULTISPECIES: hypothetical protein [unclassified Janthinobacterium]|uniref:hypothetical protein n=1 Tax=unclassified Janthinobacterium TaxID=2610881 RepID=UPI0016208CC2|nr:MULTISPECIES: hypothetical protein [unclassified Janthinobacterium]MBB5606496.1 hypothetical protein [Janthinobacterium sp. S3T4]MBB5611632.1 hypothetical protein [Janthinobacterium sp. S3M3]
MAKLAARLLAVLAGAAFVQALHWYPLGHGWPSWLFAGLLPVYFLLLCWRPALWLFCLPALLPVLDLAPWTGWFFLEEIDLLLLLTVACCYWQLHKRPATLSLSPAARLWLLLCCLAWLAALLRGLLPLPPWDANAYNNYLSSYNSLRLGKAWAWAMLLLPLLLHDAGHGGWRRYALPGLLTGLALVAGCALWERAAFPGLLNLSSDYRITAPFSAMHTGGAALDGYLALGLPFAVLWLLRARTRWHSAAALLLLAMVLHAALATFSRGLYAAMLAAAALGMVYAVKKMLAGMPATQGSPKGRLALCLLLAAAAAIALIAMFGSAGYRGLLAAVVLFSASFVLATQALPWRLAPGGVLCALAIEAVLAMLWPADVAGWLKAPYFLFLLSALLLTGALWPGRRPPGPVRLCVAMMAWTMLACNLAWISWHWGGKPALPGAILAVLLAACMLCNRRLSPPLWRLQRASLSLAGAAAVLLALAVPVSASYYATERFATSAGDLQGRLRHWQAALDMMPADAASAAFGMGLGTFPASYYWYNPLREVPARIAYLDEAGERYVRLASPGYSAGYGELLRLLQRLTVLPNTAYVLALDVRRAAAMPVLQVRLCQRQLLYAQNCISAPLRLRAADGLWQHYALPINSAWLGSGHWLQRLPVQLELAASGTAVSSVIDIDNLSLRAADGLEQIANGQFTQASDDWFFSSDHHHLPWHLKNLLLQLYVEGGLCSVLAMLGLLMLASSRLLRQHSLGHASIAALAAILAFLVVGLFDSLLDVPRIALLFYLLLLGALLQPARSSHTLPQESPPP